MAQIISSAPREVFFKSSSNLNQNSNRGCRSANFCNKSTDADGHTVSSHHEIECKSTNCYKQSHDDSHIQGKSTSMSPTISSLNTIPSHLQTALRNLTTEDQIFGESSTASAVTEKNTKTVTWSPQLVITNSDEILSQQKQKMMDVDLGSEFLTSSAVKAVKTMIPAHTAAADEIILMAAKLHRAEQGCNPNAGELLTILEDNEFKQDSLILAFMNMSKGTDSLMVDENVGFISEAECSSEHTDNTDLDHVDGLGEVLPTIKESGQMSEDCRLSALVAVLKIEHRLLVEANRCVECKERPREATFLPCGHFMLCAACSENINICPACKTEALAEVKTFLA